MGQRQRTDEIDLDVLSEREREVLDLALAGLSARAIAERLTLTEATVRSHLAHIYAKLGVGGRIELLARLNGARATASRAASQPVIATSQRRVWRAVGASVALVMLAVGMLFVAVRPGLPPLTDLATVSRLVSSGQVSSLDITGGTLAVVTADGHRYRVEGADEAAVAPIQAQAIAESVHMSVSGESGDTMMTGIAMAATSFAPIGILLLAFALVIRWVRPVRPGPAA